MRSAISGVLVPVSLAFACLGWARPASAQQSSLFFEREKGSALCESEAFSKFRASAFLFVDDGSVTVDDADPDVDTAIAGALLPFTIEVIRKPVASRKDRLAGSATVDAAGDEHPIDVLISAELKLRHSGAVKKATGTLSFVDDQQACVFELPFTALPKQAPAPPEPPPASNGGNPPGPIDPPGPPF